MLWVWSLVWCCFNSVESGVATALLVHWFDLTFYVDKSEFDTLWAIADSDDNPVRKTAFIGMFHLVSSTRVDAEENVIPIWAFNITFWLNFALFSLTADFACPDPCPLRPPWL